MERSEYVRYRFRLGVVAWFAVSLLLVGMSEVSRADTLTGLSTATAVGADFTSVTHNGTTYVVADGDLMQGATTRWYESATTGLDTIWVEGDPVPTEIVNGKGAPKIDRVGSSADNFKIFTNINNESSLDGVHASGGAWYQQTIFPSLVDTIFIFEQNGNDSGTMRAILADDSLGPVVNFSSANYASTGIATANTQIVYGAVFESDVLIKGLRIDAPGHDTFSISAPVPEPASFVLAGLSLAGISFSRCRNRRQR